LSEKEIVLSLTKRNGNLQPLPPHASKCCVLSLTKRNGNETALR